MDELERKGNALIEAADMLVAEADASGLPARGVARILFGFTILLLERRDGREGAIAFLRHQLARLENDVLRSHSDRQIEFPDLYSLRSDPN